MTTVSKQQSKRAHEVISERWQGVVGDIAVGGPQRVDQVASAGAEALPYAEVVAEDLTGRRGNVLRSIE